MKLKMILCNITLTQKVHFVWYTPAMKLKKKTIVKQSVLEVSVNKKSSYKYTWTLYTPPTQIVDCSIVIVKFQ